MLTEILDKNRKARHEAREQGKHKYKKLKTAIIVSFVIKSNSQQLKTEELNLKIQK